MAGVHFFVPPPFSHCLIEQSHLLLLDALFYPVGDRVLILLCFLFYPLSDCLLISREPTLFVENHDTPDAF